MSSVRLWKIRGSNVHSTEFLLPLIANSKFSDYELFVGAYRAKNGFIAPERTGLACSYTRTLGAFPLEPTRDASNRHVDPVRQSTRKSGWLGSTA
jgi:hypothetical protein